MKKLLSVFILGSELRQFAHSGLFSELGNSGWEITVMAKIVDDDIRSQLPSGIALVPFLKVKHSLLAETTTKIIDKAFHHRLTHQGASSWQYGKVTPKNWRETWLAWFINFWAKVFSLSRVFITLASRFEQRLYQIADRSVWKDFFHQHPIDAILINVPKQTYWYPMLVTAREMGIKTFLLYHTSKDLVANPRLNHAFTGIGVWNSKMRQDLLRLNPWVDPETIQVVGCGHFDCVGRPEWLPSEAEFRSQIGTLPDSRIILFPTSGPGIVPAEERYIDLVVQVIEKVALIVNRKLQIVFRMNPMDNRDVLSDYLKNHYPEHIVLRPDWQDNRQSNWTYARRSDPVFYNALLHYASVCVTIPSTVTLDCALSGVPVINLGIEVPGEQPLPGSLKVFWEVDFNENVRETGAARFVTSLSELENSLVDYLRDRSLDSDQREALILRELDGIRSGQSSQHSLQLITSQA
jgi:hypothetical protein